MMNFSKISGALRLTPAQAAGVNSRCREVFDMVAMIEEWERDCAGYADTEA